MGIVRFSWLLIIFIAVAVLPLSAHAQGGEQGNDARARAAELKRQGDERMTDLEYAEALKLYDQAFEINPNPALYYNRGRAYQAMRRFPDALRELEAFEREAPAKLKARVPKLAELLTSVRANVATITVTCNVQGARVLLRKLLVGHTDIEQPLQVNAGRAELQVLADGYLPVKETITLEGGEQLPLHYDLQAAGPEGVLVVRADVPGVAVFIDGQSFGTVPAEAKLQAGEHEVSIRHPDYEDYDATAVVEPGKRNELLVELMRIPNVYETWWFWTGVGALVTTGVVLAIALTTSGPADTGDIPPGQVEAPIIGLRTPVISF